MGLEARSNRRVSAITYVKSLVNQDIIESDYEQSSSEEDSDSSSCSNRTLNPDITIKALARRTGEIPNTKRSI